MATPVNTLMAEVQCYLCLGISQAEALQLALLSRIAASSTGGYEMVLGQIQGLAFADSSTYFIGELSASATPAFYTTSSSLQQAKVLASGTIAHWLLSIRRPVGAVPTNEQVSISLMRLNSTNLQITTLATVVTDLVAQVVEIDTTSFSSSPALNSGDYVWMEMITPAWVTNPGTTIITCRLAIS